MGKIERNSVEESDLTGANTIGVLLSMSAEFSKAGRFKGSDYTCLIYRHPGFPRKGFCYTREMERIKHVRTIDLPARERLPVTQGNAIGPAEKEPVTENDMESVETLGRLLELGARYVGPHDGSANEFLYRHPGIPEKRFCYSCSGTNLRHVQTL